MTAIPKLLPVIKERIFHAVENLVVEIRKACHKVEEVVLIDREDNTGDQNVLLEKKQPQKEGCTIPHRHEIHVDRNQTSESVIKNNYIRIQKTS
jgi:hypothetical protein